MEDKTNSPLLMVACRFVPYDQWMVTHLDTSWTIKQAKRWILSKCSLPSPPDAPRYRPVSPITFAAIDTRSSFDLDDQSSGQSASDGSGETNEIDSGFRKYRNRSLGERVLKSERPSVPSIDGPSIDTQSYTLVTFSTCQILDDNCILSWFGLHPYELLEMHPAGVVISLPREIVAEYVRPYFEAKVQALRLIKKRVVEGSPRRSGRSADGTQSAPHAADPVAEEVLGNERRDKRRKESRTTVEWGDRWLVIHRGILSIGNDRSDRNPYQKLPISSLMALKGAEYLSKYSISSAKGRRVLCAKFRLSCGQNNLTEGDLPNSHPPLSSTPSYPSSNHKDEVYSVPAFPTLGPNERKNPKKKASISGVMFGAWRNEPGRQNGPDKSYSHSSSMPARTSEQEDEVKQSDSRLNGQQRPDVKGVTAGDEGQWVILDMYDDTAYASLLRILHRHSPRPISTFLPATSTLTSNTPSSDGPPQHPNVSFTSPFSGDPISPLGNIGPIPTQAIPYPEWRINVVIQARKAGLGAIGKAMDLVKWNDYNSLPSANIRPERSRRDTVATSGSGRSEATIQPSQSADGSKPVDGFEELSDVEWEGWIRDLDRQTEVEALRRRDETVIDCSPRQDSPSPPQPGLSTESFHQRTRTATFSRSIPLASALPSTLAHIPSNNPPTSSATRTASVGLALRSRRRPKTVTVNNMLWRKDRNEETKS